MADTVLVRLLKTDISGWNRSVERFRADSIAAGGPSLDLSGADLAAADLTGADLGVADLRGANLEGAVLLRANLFRATLRDAKMRRAKLMAAELMNADLEAADLHGAELEMADLRKSNLSRTDLGSANLTEANLSEANLEGSNLNRAWCVKTILRSTRLLKADFSHLGIGASILADLDLSEVADLTSCQHLAPCHIDVLTLQRSGRLPREFLRGCGLPDRLIEYLPSLLEDVIQFYSCFISYSTDDQAFADRLYADLQSRGIRCWFAPHDIRGGRKIHEQLEEAIRKYDRLLLILSESSMISEWVRTEIEHAREKERLSGKHVLFPLALVPFKTVKAWRQFNAEIGSDNARRIREFYIPDFSKWKEHDAYSAAFARLLEALRTEGTQGAE